MAGTSSTTPKARWSIKSIFMWIGFPLGAVIGLMLAIGEHKDKARTSEPAATERPRPNVERSPLYCQPAWEEPLYNKKITVAEYRTDDDFKTAESVPVPQGCNIELSVAFTAYTYQCFSDEEEVWVHEGSPGCNDASSFRFLGKGGSKTLSFRYVKRPGRR